MASLSDIRRRIRSVKNTQQITKAMKMVAAAKLRRASDRVVAARPYANSLATLLGNLTARVGENPPELLKSRDRDERILLLVVTGDKGLCGAFNQNITRAASNFIAEKTAEGKVVQLVTIGKKGTDWYRRRDIEIVAQYPGIFSKTDRADAAAIAKIATDEFLKSAPSEDATDGERGVDSVWLIFNEFKSVIQQNLITEKLLPVEPPDVAEESGGDYIYEPSAEALLDSLLPRHLEFQVYRSLLESSAAEHGARMTAMDAASKNAGEMIDSLTLTYNRARQARITKELIEIVSGANAL